jgi:hypothetical protein
VDRRDGDKLYLTEEQ